MWINIFFIIIAIIGILASYSYAKKLQNKKILIVTYISIFVFIISLSYLTLDLILVGGIN